MHDDTLLLQKQGVCIGASVATVLSDFFLSMSDRAIEVALRREVIRVVRYVDDYLVFFRNVSGESKDDCIENMSCAFKSNSCGLNFTRENPVHGRPQFLDINLSFNEDHVCWRYWPRTKKGGLPFDFSHSKVVKRGIRRGFTQAALVRFRPHQMLACFCNQADRLSQGGYL